MTLPLRDIRRSEQFERLCAEFEPDVRRLDEQLLAVEWAIARNPDYADIVKGNLRVIETSAVGPEDEYVFVYFTVDDGGETCTMQWIAAGNEVVQGDHNVEQIL